MPGADYENGIKINAANMLSLKRAINGNGIVSGFGCTRTGILTVQCAAGIGYTNGTRRDVVGALSFVLASNLSAYDRWDIIELTSAGFRNLIQGTPNISPKLPDLSTDAILIAAILIPSGATDIIEGNIRPFGFYSTLFSHNHTEAVTGTDQKLSHQNSLTSVLGASNDINTEQNKHISNAQFKAIEEHVHGTSPYLKVNIPTGALTGITDITKVLGSDGSGIPTWFDYKGRKLGIVVSNDPADKPDFTTIKDAFAYIQTLASKQGTVFLIGTQSNYVLTGVDNTAYIMNGSKIDLIGIGKPKIVIPNNKPGTYRAIALDASTNISSPTWLTIRGCVFRNEFICDGTYSGVGFGTITIGTDATNRYWKLEIEDNTFEIPAGQSTSWPTVMILGQFGRNAWDCQNLRINNNHFDFTAANAYGTILKIDGTGAYANILISPQFTNNNIRAAQTLQDTPMVSFIDFSQGTTGNRIVGALIEGNTIDGFYACSHLIQAQGEVTDLRMTNNQISLTSGYSNQWGTILMANNLLENNIKDNKFYIQFFPGATAVIFTRLLIGTYGNAPLRNSIDNNQFHTTNQPSAVLQYQVRILGVMGTHPGGSGYNRATNNWFFMDTSWASTWIQWWLGAKSMWGGNLHIHNGSMSSDQAAIYPNNLQVP